MLVSLGLAAAEAAPVANPISFEIWTLVWQAINVLAIMAILYFLLFKPVGGMMQKRESFVEETLSSAKKTKEEAEQLLAEYQEQLKQAGDEARAIVEKASQDAEEYAKKRRVEADEEAEQLLTRARVEIANEREQAVRAIRDEMAGLAVLAASQVLGRAIEPKDHEALVRDFVAKVGEPH